MKIEEVKAGQPIRVGEITLVPIERTFVSCVGMERGAAVRGSKGLAGIVVVSGKNRYAIDLTGEEVPVNRYLKQVQELARVLDGRSGPCPNPESKDSQPKSIIL